MKLSGNLLETAEKGLSENNRSMLCCGFSLHMRTGTVFSLKSVPGKQVSVFNKNLMNATERKHGRILKEIFFEEELEGNMEVGLTKRKEEEILCRKLKELRNSEGITC